MTQDELKIIQERVEKVASDAAATKSELKELLEIIRERRDRGEGGINLWGYEG